MQNAKLYRSLLTIFCLLSCSRHKTEVKLNVEDEFTLAKSEFEYKHYDKAIDGFKRVIFRYPGSKWVEESQYLLAKAYLEKKDHTQAELEYDFFIQSYPRSRFADDAYFELSLCYFKESPPYGIEQSLTKKALQLFRSFIAKYPDSELIDKAREYEKKCIDKLVKKELETAKLYVKLGKPASAILYLKDIQQSYPDNSYSKEIARLLEYITHNK
ncbi:MAG: outer membrane protein assembly factor BamD [bacterium]|nr:outer membrane protein assembly factor BamD [bacterium]